MKKCTRCNVVFYLNERLRCLYCDTRLITTDTDDPAKLRKNVVQADRLEGEHPFVRWLLKDRGIERHGRMQFMIGSYFRVRTFKFMYNFSRNEMRMNKDFKRILIQPLSIMSFLTIPWVIWNFIDSMAIRFLYNAHCERCNWKYKKYVSGQKHQRDECEYCLEYSALMEDVLNGRIIQTEPRFKRQAYRKVTAGKKSAYRDLFALKSQVDSFLDVTSIWFSLLILLFLGVLLFFPVAIKMIFQMQSQDYLFIMFPNMMM